MNNKSYVFHRFLNLILKILFLLPVIGSIYYFHIKDDDNLLFSFIYFFISIILIGFTHYGLKKDYNTLLIVTIILTVAFIIRFLWFYSIDSIPISDFNRMFVCAEDFANGYNYMFKGYSYFARFPHMSMTVIYFSLIIKIFSNPLVAIRFINIIFSMINIILLFFISNEVFKEKKKNVWVLLLSSIYPPMIIYNNIYCSENMAMPLLLLSILMFFKAINGCNKNKLLFFSLSGLSLSAMHLFRPLGYIMIIAYSMYIFIYFKEKLKLQIISSLFVLLMFVIPYVIVSYTLMALNITEYPLWNATEPISMSVLKGTNIEAEGGWNEEDYSLIDKYDGDYENLDKAAKEIIKQRLTTTPKIELFKFYVYKYSKQWSVGDFGGAYWSKVGLDEAYNKEHYLDIMGKKEGRNIIKLSDDMQIYTQIFYIMILTFSYIGLYKNKKAKNFKIDFFYIMFCGLALQCLLTEAQDRYSYPFSWIFIILAITAFNNNTVNGNGGKNE
ncbi:glycosyltransferase family 39 protein [Clostridium beijerinckii]|uniref:glycosyltransferase family 39 protein n=1 Tax=Clostridium beijerinckii TaxID=1520 RepID=UPI001811FCA6|nr:glycosyltransferase family 39 protein [Clostridium beijerinckii]NOW07165.1 hypothetical protein [Clostridium beijerinckii]NYC05061.1 hypothetical protein [Clostridium beijerinckii]